MPVDNFQFDLPSSPRSRAAHVARPLLSSLAGFSRLLTLYRDTHHGPADMCQARAESGVEGARPNVSGTPWPAADSSTAINA